MSTPGQTRRFRDVRLRSGPPLNSRHFPTGRHLAFGPVPDLASGSSHVYLAILCQSAVRQPGVRQGFSDNRDNVQTIPGFPEKTADGRDC